MNFKSFIAGPDDDNRRIDRVIRVFAKNLSLSQIYKALRKGLIKVNGKKVPQNSKIFQNDEIQIADFLLENQENNKILDNPFKPEDIKLPPEVFKNEHIVIFNKPRGLKVHGDNSLAQMIECLYKTSNHEQSLSFTPGPLHRIDRNTTGLIVFSQSITGAQTFSKYIKEHIITKKYRAILQGHLSAKVQWNDFIEKNESENSAFHTVNVKTNLENQNQKDALTIVTPLAYGKYKNIELTYVEIEIFTGRQHQIRAQSAFHKYPLFGDSAYNSSSIINQFYLHAYELIIPQDNTLKLPQTITAPLPQDFSAFLSEYFLHNKLM